MTYLNSKQGRTAVVSYPANRKGRAVLECYRGGKLASVASIPSKWADQMARDWCGKGTEAR